MAATQTEGQATVIAVFPDHASAEDAMRRLHKEGIPMQSLSIIGKDFQLVEKPLGLVTTGDVAKGGAKIVAWTGGILGLLVGAACLLLPRIGMTDDMPSRSSPMRSDADKRKQPRKFDPAGFTVVAPRRFEDLRVGEVFRAPSRTLTDAHASAFQAVSADNHPIHYDLEYARRHGHSAPVVHGLQVLACTAPGATLFPQYIGDVFLAFTSASCKFLKEVHAGDTLYPQLEIIKLTTQGATGIVTTRATVHNQRGEIVLDGEHTYSLKAGSGDKK
jgi:acyl dehydratase